MALTMAEIRARLQVQQGGLCESTLDEEPTEQPDQLLLVLYEYLKHANNKTRDIIAPEIRGFNGERFGCSPGVVSGYSEDKFTFDPRLYQLIDILSIAEETMIMEFGQHSKTVYDMILQYNSLSNELDDFSAADNSFFVCTGWYEDSIEAATVFRVDYKEWSFDVFVFYSRVEDETHGNIEGYVVSTKNHGPIASDLASVIPFTDAWEFDMRMHGIQ